MSYDGRETSVSSGQPYELYWFATAADTWRYTSGDVARTYLGATYTPDYLQRTGTSQTSEVRGGHVTVTVPRDHPIAQLFIAFIPSTPLTLVIYRGHDGEADTEMKVAFTGRVLLGRFTTEDTCELDCAPDTEVLQRSIASRLFQRPCNRMLYDAGCGINRAVWKVSGAVRAVSADGLTVTLDAAAAKPDGWLATGYLERGTDRRMIVTHAGAVLTLINPLIGLAAGDPVIAYAGCDRSYGGSQGCVAKFANGPRFLGWEWIPTKNPFSSGVA